MKFFHLSDLHIGLKLMNRDLREEQIDILRQITELAKAEKPDAVVIAGDIYDKAVPAAEAVEIFDGFMTELKKAVPKAEIMLISGNHDSFQFIPDLTDRTVNAIIRLQLIGFRYIFLLRIRKCIILRRLCQRVKLQFCQPFEHTGIFSAIICIGQRFPTPVYISSA